MSVVNRTIGGIHRGAHFDTNLDNILPFVFLIFIHHMNINAVLCGFVTDIEKSRKTSKVIKINRKKTMLTFPIDQKFQI